MSRIGWHVWMMLFLCRCRFWIKRSMWARWHPNVALRTISNINQVGHYLPLPCSPPVICTDLSSSGGGEMKIESHKMNIKAKSKVGSMDNVGPGNGQTNGHKVRLTSPWAEVAGFAESLCSYCWIPLDGVIAQVWVSICLPAGSKNRRKVTFIRKCPDNRTRKCWQGEWCEGGNSFWRRRTERVC